MRKPNKYVLDELARRKVCYTQRWQYCIYRDVPVPGLDLIQRIPLYGLDGADQIVIDRESGASYKPSNIYVDGVRICGTF